MVSYPSADVKQTTSLTWPNLIINAIKTLLAIELQEDVKWFHACRTMVLILAVYAIPIEHTLWEPKVSTQSDFIEIKYC